MKTNTSYPVFFGLLFLLLSTSVFAQTYGETIQEEKLLPTIFNEFYTGTDDVIDVTVKTDMREWIKKRPTEEYQKAVLSFKSK